ncbi:MAG: FGGY family carbohydrate kinase [Pseudomonadota bacterium]
MTELLLGIDLGTTSVKAGLFDERGRRVARFHRPLATNRPAADRCEQKPEDWIELIDAALSAFRAEVPNTPIAAGAVTSQVNTHVFVDRAGAPLMPAIVWQDTRAAKEAEELDARLTEAEKIRWFGAPVPIDASHALARMLWVARHRPDIWDRTAHVLLPKDYVLRRLTGALATDPLSNVGLVGLNGRYVLEVLALVPGAAERLPVIRGLTEIIGRTQGGVPIVNATMDGWIGLVGTGACREQAFAYQSGTSEVLGAASSKVTGAPGIVVFPEAEGITLHAGPTQSGGASQHWFCGVTGIDIHDMVKLVEGSDRRRPAPLFLPQLAGERAPLWNAGLRGAFLGVGAEMQLGEFARGVYEGVALSARHVLQALEASCGLTADEIYCSGGGFGSGPWGQIRADVLGKPLKRLAVVEAGVVGAACFAALAAGHADSLAAAQAPFLRFDQTWLPDPSMRGLYDDLFGIYLDAITANEAVGRRLTSTWEQVGRP